MDRLHKGGNPDVKVDTISFNAVLDAWARSGDRVAPRRAEQILDHMDELYRSGNKGVKPDHQCVGEIRGTRFCGSCGTRFVCYGKTLP